MILFSTKLKAECVGVGGLATFTGPPVLANTWDEAQTYCLNNGLGYLEIDGVLLYHVSLDGAFDKLTNVSNN